MNVACPECNTIFRVDPEKVPPAGVRARCSVCSAVFRVEREGTASRPPAVLAGAAVGSPSTAAPPPASSPVSVPTAGPAGPAPAARRGAALPPPAAPPSVADAGPAPGGASRAAEPAVGRESGRTPAATAPARPINPFLAQDPMTKARRLARALVSDIVVYNPGKRRDGLRDGSLKSLFEEEIRKSWEEYVDQVGRELADSTPFFTDALNEILADGQRVFS